MDDFQPDDFDSSDLAVAILMERIVRGVYDARQSREIQPLQWSILRYLSRFPCERRTQKLIAAYLGLSHAPVSRAIRTLIDRGLVSVAGNPADARSNIVSLTPAGEEALKIDPLRKIALRVHGLPDADRNAIKRSLRTIAVDKTS